MKFDVCIQNPPYDNGLCNKFLVKSFELADISVSVMPSAWLLGKKQKADITKWFDMYGGEIEEINGNDYFDANIGGSMSINYLNQNSKDNKIIFDGKEYEKCSEISRFSNDVFLTEFKNIVEPLYKSDSLNNHIRRLKDTKAFTSCKIETNPDPEWWVYRTMAFSGHSSARSKEIG